MKMNRTTKFFYANYNEDINAKLNIIYNYLKDEQE